MGVKIRNSHSTQNENDQIFATAGGTGSFGLSQVLGTYTNPTYYDGSFKVGGLGYGPTSDYAKIQQAIAADLASATPTLLFQQLASVQKSQGAFFDANERVSAGYIQNAISVGKFRFQAGVRFDGTSTDFTTHHVDATVIDASGNPLITPVQPGFQLLQGAAQRSSPVSAREKYQPSRELQHRHFSAQYRRPGSHKDRRS